MAAVDHHQLGHGRPLFLMLYVALIVFFAFFYTAIVFNPTETADNLKKHGGFIPGIRPGERTAEYIDYVLTRITVLGALYLAIVCLIPEILISYASVPFYFGGTSLLIVVSVTMDTVAQIQGYLLAHQYEGLIRKSKLRGALNPLMAKSYRCRASKGKGVVFAFADMPDQQARREYRASVHPWHRPEEGQGDHGEGQAARDASVSQLTDSGSAADPRSDRPRLSWSRAICAAKA
jgi:hypothetical protein